MSAAFDNFLSSPVILVNQSNVTRPSAPDTLKTSSQLIDFKMWNLP